VKLNRAGDAIEQAQIALAAIAPTPVFAKEASEWLSGQPAEEATYLKAGELARKVATPISDMRGTAEYRVHLVGVRPTPTRFEPPRRTEPSARPASTINHQRRSIRCNLLPSRLGTDPLI
jgi:hypothetical protein